MLHLITLTQALSWMSKTDTENKGFLTEEDFQRGVEARKVNTELYLKLTKGNEKVKQVGLDRFKSLVRNMEMETPKNKSKKQIWQKSRRCHSAVYCQTCLPGNVTFCLPHEF